MRTSTNIPDDLTWINIKSYLAWEVFDQEKQQICASMMSDRSYF